MKSNQWIKWKGSKTPEECQAKILDFLCSLEPQTRSTITGDTPWFNKPVSAVDDTELERTRADLHPWGVSKYSVVYLAKCRTTSKCFNNDESLYDTDS